MDELQKPFNEFDIEWRIQSVSANSGTVTSAKCLAYVTNRAIMQRLDEVFTPFGWQNEFRNAPEGGVMCGISVLHEGQWITKWDGAENTNVEAVKGGLSASMKRAAVQWGIGRYLYNLDEGWADVTMTKKSGYKWATAKDKDKKEVSFYWLPPKLPKWALPDDSVQVDDIPELTPEQQKEQTWNKFVSFFDNAKMAKEFLSWQQIAQKDIEKMVNKYLKNEIELGYQVGNYIAFLATHQQ